MPKSTANPIINNVKPSCVRTNALFQKLNGKKKTMIRFFTGLQLTLNKTASDFLQFDNHRFWHFADVKTKSCCLNNSFVMYFGTFSFHYRFGNCNRHETDIPRFCIDKRLTERLRQRTLIDRWKRSPNRVMTKAQSHYLKRVRTLLTRGLLFRCWPLAEINKQRYATGWEITTRRGIWRWPFK